MMRSPLPILFALQLPLLGCGGEGTGVLDASLMHTVQRGDLEITVREQGDLQAFRDTQVASQLEGRDNTLIYLIDEGSFVQAGEKVAELDVSEIEERRANQAIDLANAEASLEQAKKNHEIMEEELKAARNTAENRLKIAQMRKEKFIGQPKVLPEGVSDLGEGTNREMMEELQQLLDTEIQEDPSAELKYADLLNGVLELMASEEDPENPDMREDNLDLEMGEMANQILQQIDSISLARADLKLAAETLDHSRKLNANDFITRNELERDEISWKRQESNVTLSWNNLQLLIKYTLPETLIGLNQEVDNAELGLKSQVASNEAQRVREQSMLRSAEAHFLLAQERLDNYDQQIENAVMRAPAPGLVVYAQEDDDWDDRVMEGMTVRERQILIVLPDVTTMVAHFKVHEAQIDKVAAGQYATVRLDAFPERTFSGKVNMVSALPDSSSRWNNQNLRVYKCTVLLDVDNTEMTLRPGMTATVEIQVGAVNDVLVVPLTAIKRRGDSHYAWKVTPEGPVAAEVVLGSNNLTHVEILSGLAEGDQIYLVQPPGMLLPGQAPRAEAQDDTQAVEASSDREGGPIDGSPGRE